MNRTPPCHSSVGWRASFNLSSSAFVTPGLQYRKAGLRTGVRAADSGILFGGGWQEISNAEQTCGWPSVLRGDSGLFPGEFAGLLEYKIILLPLCVAVNPLVRCFTVTFCPLSQEEISLQPGDLFPVKLNRRIRFPERACGCNKGWLGIS